MADVTLGAALVAGLVAFFTPCVLPIVPAILSFVGGGVQDTTVPRSLRMVRIAAFVLGFGIAFTLLGLLVATAASSLASKGFETWLDRIGGTIVIVFGLAMTGLLRLRWMDRDLRFHGKAPAWMGPTFGALFLGAAFGVGWSPCVGPLLGGILVAAGRSGGAAAGALLLATFSFGMALPFLAFGLAADQGAALLRRWSRATRVVEVVGGVLLIVLGIFIFTGSTNRVLSFFG